MSAKTKRSIVAVNVFVIFLMLCLFGLGYFAVHVSDKALNSTTVDFDSKLKGRIGKPYTHKQHNYVVDVLYSGDEQNESLIRSLNSLSRVAFSLGGASAVLLLFSTFLIIRDGKKNVVEQVASSDSAPLA